MIPRHQRWLSLREIATQTEIPLSDLGQYVQDGDLVPFAKHGNQVRFWRSDLFEFFEGNDVGRLVSISKVAKHFDVLPETVRLWCQRGDLKYVRIGTSHYLIDSDSIPSWPKEERRAKPDWAEQSDCVYFIQENNGGPVKIGYTSFPVKERVRQIEGGFNRKVQLVVLLSIEGPRLLERHIHAEFVAQREKGEWFRPTKELAEFIERHGGNPPILEH